LFDSHCHLHDERMAAVRDAALRRARAAGVRGLLLAGVDLGGWQIQAQLAAASGDIEMALAYGVHPQIVEALSDDEIDRQLQILGAALQAGVPALGLPRPQAVGELGLDALTAARRAGLPRQERVFRAQLALARTHDLPLVLHILRTHGEALRILKGDGVPRCGGVVHSYSGSAELVADYVALGLSISFSGAITYPQSRRLQAAARVVPRDRLLIETDAPDQTPWPQRPAANEPAWLGTVCDALAAIRGEDRGFLAQMTEDNARRLFRLRMPLEPEGPTHVDARNN
jgi:TatD DNase family protein